MKDVLAQKTDEKLSSMREPRFYVEPFAGGFGAFFSVAETLRKHGIRDVFLNDVNRHSVSVYNLSVTHPKSLSKKFAEIERRFWKSLPNADVRKPSKSELEAARDFYMEARERFNSVKNGRSRLEAAALFLFLQFHNFNGVYRENSFGEYNIPFNWQNKRIDPDSISSRIADAGEVLSSFNLKTSSNGFESLDYSLQGLYYADPPYFNDGEFENKYGSSPFGLNEQISLLKLLAQTDFIYSNHSSPTILRHMEEIVPDGFEIVELKRPNFISCSNESRKKPKTEMLAISKTKPSNNSRLR